MDSKLWCKPKVFATIVAKLLNFKAKVMPTLEGSCNLGSQTNFTSILKCRTDCSGSKWLISPCEVLWHTKK
jgi:hypothetical protein